MLQYKHKIVQHRGLELSGKWGAVLLVASLITSLAGVMAYLQMDTEAENQWVWLLFFGIALFYAVLTYPFFDSV